MKIVLLGPPGAGKGTQCKKIVEWFGIQHLSSGDILRQERAKGTELGKKAQDFMDSGALVPDRIVVEMMTGAIMKASKKGFVLDGFPRTINQARRLDESLAKAGHKINAILNLKIDDKIIVKRITGRRSCPSCGDVYHIENMKPRKDNLCDKCGAALIQRPDDTEEVFASRLKNYYEQTAPVIDYYKANNTVYDIDSNKDSGEVAALMLEKLDALSNAEKQVRR
jgi:adenylate kinase